MSGFLPDFAPVQGLFSMIGDIFPYTWFIIFPVALWYIFLFLWMDFVWDGYLAKLNFTILEIIPPRDIEKSPLPMELIFDALASTEKTLSTYEEFLVGELLPKFSLEIMSDGGAVHLYVRMETRFRNIIESALYGQYPDIQLVEAEDYVKAVPLGIPNKEWNLWGTNFILTKHDSYPIRTYRNFQEDVTGKMIDPLSYLFEIMGKLPPGHKIWYQIIFAPTKPSWFEEGKQFVNELMTKMAKEKGVDSNDLTALEAKLTPVEKKVLEAVELNIGKTMFRTRIRFMYLGPSGNFDKSSFVTGFVGAIKQFNDSNLNSFKPEADSKTFANYLWAKSRLRYRQRILLQRYKNRSVDPFSSTIILSSAELATLFHVPDMVVMAPSLTRVGAKRGSAPGNLPVD
jgi:hypothetical protein